MAKKKRITFSALVERRKKESFSNEVTNEILRKILNLNSKEINKTNVSNLIDNHLREIKKEDITSF